MPKFRFKGDGHHAVCTAFGMDFPMSEFVRVEPGHPAAALDGNPMFEADFSEEIAAADAAKAEAEKQAKADAKALAKAAAAEVEAEKTKGPAPDQNSGAG